MSGPNWSPGWLLDGPPIPWVRQLVSGGRVVESGYRDYFTDAVARSAQRLLLRTVVSALKDHPAIWMWNLGNEPLRWRHSCSRHPELACQDPAQTGGAGDGRTD